MVSGALREKLKAVLRATAYDRVVLFGSRVRDDSTDQSDLDILVILKDSMAPRDKLKLSTELRKRLAVELLDADVLVKDRQDVEYLRDKCGSVVRNALREGVSL